jgi:ribonuclease Z
MKTLAKTSLAFFVAAVIAYALAQELLVTRVMERIVYKNFSANLLDELPDGLHVILCGAGSPMPDPKRSGPCTAVIAGKQLYIVDVGAGASLNLTQYKVPQGDIDAVLLTHFHSDHIDGLGELLLQRWVNAANDSPTPIYGPKGVEEIAEGFNLAYQQDQAYRVAHHGAETVIPGGAGSTAMPFELPQNGELKTVLERDGLKISTLAVEHEPVSPAVGYRFDYKGRSVVISGDTKKSANLQALSQDIDLLVHEALNTNMVNTLAKAAEKAERPRMLKILNDIWDYHTTPVEAAEIARDANAKHLLYTHIVPPLPFPPMEKVFLKGVKDVYEEGVTLGKDGTMVSLKAESKEIKVKHLKGFM